MVKDGSFLRLADELGVRRHIHVVGQVDHEFIRHYLAVANVETHDLDGLGLGITSVEAMCGGLPVVAWVPRDNYPGIDLASYGTLGFVETGDPKEISSMIIRCVLDQTFVNEVRSSQDRLVREVFSPAAVTEKYLELLERLITKD
jgi:1,2-diacylglycerol 3-alpha-glucosyltransferase